MTYHSLVAAIAVLALAACAEGGGDSGEAAAAAQADPATTSQVASGQQFVDAAAASDAYEMEAAGIASDRGTSGAVRDFAAMMERDHALSTANLKLAAASVTGVSVAPRLTARQRSDLDALRNAEDGNFDATYVRQQVAAHEAALETLRGYAAQGEAQPLRDFAAAAAPAVGGHLEAARNLR